MTRRFVTMLVSVFLSSAAITGQVTTRYVNNDVTCSNSVAAGTEALPLCTMAYVASLNATNITYYVDSTRDLSGPTFDAVASFGNEIRYISRNNTKLGGGVDAIDANFVPHISGTPGVFTLTGGPTFGQVWQTHWTTPIVVDEPDKPSYFEMIDSNGPLKMMSAPDDTTLFANEGSYRFSGGALHVHTFGNLTPSISATDLVVGQNPTMAFVSDSMYLVLEGFQFTYTGSANAMLIQGWRNTIRNSTWAGQPLRIQGNHFNGENLRVAHVIERQPEGCLSPCTDNIWTWHYLGAGSAASITSGVGHRLTNIEVMHSWNASISNDGASLTDPPIVNRAKAHGSPNHCSVVSSHGGIARNSILYNCQDYQWVVQPVDPAVNPTGMLLEHVTLPGGGIGVEAETAVIGKLTIRNSIISGNFTFIRGLQSRCFWGNTTVEYSILSTAATIERCEDNNDYPIATYLANCAAKTWTNCITFSNITYVAPEDFDDVIEGGMWCCGGSVALDTWEPRVIGNGPAHDTGTPSAVVVDLDGAVRPQGDAPDMGAYEFADDLSLAIYVDNSCANNGNGSAHTCAASAGAAGAFNALQPALDAAASPGDTVYIKNGSGTYVTTTGTRGNGVNFDSGFAITHSGTEVNPITVRNYTGHSPLIANCADGTTDHLSCNRLTFSAWCQEGVRITGLRIRGAVGMHCTAATEVTLKRWNEVDHNEITKGYADTNNGNWSGIWYSQQRFAHLHHNYLHDIALMTNAGTQSSASAIKSHTSVDAVVEYNTIINVVTSQAGGIDDKQDSVRNTYRYNWIRNVDTCFFFQNQIGPGPYTTGTGTVAYQNVCIGRAGQGPLWQVGIGALTDVTVYNNVFYQGTQGLWVQATSGSTDGIRHYNNIYDAITVQNVDSDFSTTADIDLENYNTYDPDANYMVAGASYTSLTAYVAAVAARNAGSSEAACVFVNPGTDFHLVSGTCVGGGRTGGTSGGAALDRGAYVGGIRCVGYGCEAPTGVK